MRETELQTRTWTVGIVASGSSLSEVSGADRGHVRTPGPGTLSGSESLLRLGTLPGFASAPDLATQPRHASGKLTALKLGGVACGRISAMPSACSLPVSLRAGTAPTRPAHHATHAETRSDPGANAPAHLFTLHFRPALSLQVPAAAPGPAVGNLGTPVEQKPFPACLKRLS